MNICQKVSFEYIAIYLHWKKLKFVHLAPGVFNVNLRYI